MRGFGFGLFQTPNNRTMVTAAPRSRSGAAGGLLATARLTGQTAGATAVAVLFALQPGQAGALALALAMLTAAALGVPAFARALIEQGMPLPLRWPAALAECALALAAFFLHRPRPRLVARGRAPAGLKKAREA